MEPGPGMSAPATILVATGGSVLTIDPRGPVGEWHCAE